MDLTVSSYRVQQPSFKGDVALPAKTLFKRAILEKGKNTVNYAMNNFGQPIEDLLSRITTEGTEAFEKIMKYMEEVHEDIVLTKDPENNALLLSLRRGKYKDSIALDSIYDTSSCKGFDRLLVTAKLTESNLMKPKVVAQRFIDRMFESPQFKTVEEATEAARQFAEETDNIRYFNRIKENAVKNFEERQNRVNKTANSRAYYDFKANLHKYFNLFV